MELLDKLSREPDVEGMSDRDLFLYYMGFEAATLNRKINLADMNPLLAHFAIAFFIKSLLEGETSEEEVLNQKIKRVIKELRYHLVSFATLVPDAEKSDDTIRRFEHAQAAEALKQMLKPDPEKGGSEGGDLQ